MAGFLLRSIVTAIALWIAVALVPGLSARDMGALMLAAIILSFPLTLPTFGLFLLVVNAAMLAIAGWLVPGFTVAGFWPALAGAIVVSLVSAVVGGALPRA